jgi:hypothetical protein
LGSKLLFVVTFIGYGLIGGMGALGDGGPLRSASAVNVAPCSDETLHVTLVSGPSAVPLLLSTCLTVTLFVTLPPFGNDAIMDAKFVAIFATPAKNPAKVDPISPLLLCGAGTKLLLAIFLLLLFPFLILS